MEAGLPGSQSEKVQSGSNLWRIVQCVGTLLCAKRLKLAALFNIDEVSVQVGWELAQ